jgi:uncharacterized protein (TIGR03067 family)
MRKSCFLALAASFLAAANSPAVVDRPPKKKADPTATEAQLLQGTWQFEDLEFNGRRYGKQIALKFGNPVLVIANDQLTIRSSRGATTIKLRIDPTKNPKEIDLAGIPLGNSGQFTGTYTLEKDMLKTGPGTNGGPRYIFHWKRVPIQAAK